MPYPDQVASVTASQEHEFVAPKGKATKGLAWVKQILKNRPCPVFPVIDVWGWQKTFHGESRPDESVGTVDLFYTVGHNGFRKLWSSHIQTPGSINLVKNKSMSILYVCATRFL